MGLAFEQRYADWYPRSDKSLFFWAFFESSDYQTLPFPGGLADQPEWLMNDFSGFMELTEYHELVAERQALQRRLARSLH